MAVVTICFTCFVIFMADANQEDLGQVWCDDSVIIIDHVVLQGRNNLGNVMTHTHYTRFGTITGR